MSIAAMLPAFRKALTPLLVQTCRARTVINTPDGHSGYTQSWPGPGIAFACDCQATGSTDAGDLSWFGADAFTVLCTTDVKLENGAFIDVAGLTLKVLSNEPPPTINALHKYECVRTEGGTT